MINIDITSPKDTNKKGLGLTVIQWKRNNKIIGALKSFSNTQVAQTGVEGEY